MYKKPSGRKIDESPYVLQITKLLYEHVPYAKIERIIKQKYSFKASVPSVRAFKEYFYPIRLEEIKKYTKDFQEEHSGKIRTFIDESTNQAGEMKGTITSLEGYVRELKEEMAFIRKFERLFRNGLEKYIDDFDPENPAQFLTSDSSPEEKTLAEAVKSLGEEGKFALGNFFKTHSPAVTIRLLAMLEDKILANRRAVVTLHKDVFKAYRNFSMLQEITVVFEKYNGIIIEEFFPDKDKVDKQKYERLRRKILTLFEELQIRYQGLDHPSDKPARVSAPTSASASAPGEKEPELPKKKSAGAPLTRKDNLFDNIGTVAAASPDLDTNPTTSAEKT